MKTQTAQRIKRTLYKLVKGDALVLVAAFLLLLSLVNIKINTGGLDWGELDPSAGLFEMIIVAIIGWMVIVIKRALLNYLEDDVKLTNDYEGLIATYLPSDIEPEEASFVTFDNTGSSDSNLALLKADEPKLFAGTGRLGSLPQTIFPVVVEHLLPLIPVNEVIVEDSTDLYELPIVVQANYKSIISAHQESHLYNQLVVRVRDWRYEAEKLCLHTERSSYFNSMVTNRAMDYDFGEITVRKLFEYGPRVSPLATSRLSNHLGFNAFLITADGYVPFVKRGRGLSIGKGTFGDSVGASLKAKYALDPATGELTAEGIENAVLREIEDELKVFEAELFEKPLVIAAYRDLLEGGKPQLLIVAKTTLTHSDLDKRFKSNIAQKARRNLPKDIELLEDGKMIAWLSVSNLRHSAISPGALYCSGVQYDMVPSASASVAMLLNSDRKYNHLGSYTAS